MKEQILSQLSAECPWRDTLLWFDTIDSTNTKAKELAASGAPHGTVVVAGTQTGGRGRLGRSFSSPAGLGMYLSVILRPGCRPDQLMHLTCAAAVAACDAVEKAAGFRPRIKWTNDLVCGKQKLGGILTELSVNSQSGLVDFAIIGIGINCLQAKEDFPAELQETATSIHTVSGKAVSPAVMACAVIESLVQMDLSSKEAIMGQYKKDCMTLGKQIVVVRGDQTQYGVAEDLDADGGLVVRFPDGTVKTVTSGEVSVRGMYGYV